MRANADSGCGLPQCPPYDHMGEVLAYANHPLNQLVMESRRRTVGFSGTGRVRRIEGSAGSPGGVSLVSVLLDTPGECGPEIPAQISIIHPGVDWGLQVGSQLRVDLVGNRAPFINGGGGGAVVRLPDGSLLAAFFDRDGEEYLTSFLARLPIAISFAPECRDAGPPAACHLAAIRKSMSLPGSVRLKQHETTTISISGAAFHLGLGTASDRIAFTGCSSTPDDPPPLGPTYRLHLLRLPQP